MSGFKLAEKLSQLSSRYSDLLKKYPYRTNVLTSVVLFGGADVVSQFFIQKKTLKEYEVWRSISLTIIGSLFITPSLEVWLKHIMPRMINSISSSEKLRPLISVSLHQTVFTLYANSGWLFLNEYLSSFDFERAVKNIRENIVRVTITGQFVWVPVQFINFSFIAPQFRIFFNNSISFFWNIYMSLQRQSNQEVKA